MLFTFHSPLSVDQTKNAVVRAVNAMGGSAKYGNSVEVVAKLRSKRFLTVMPQRFVFYVGDGAVRVTTNHGATGNEEIMLYSYKPGAVERIWDDFVRSLLQNDQEVDFGLTAGEATLDEVVFVGDGTEQIFTSRTRNCPSFGGAIAGGVLFGTPGAVIGGMGGHQTTVGTSVTQFSDRILAKVRYTNGRTIEGYIRKNVPVYNQIMVNMNKFE